MKDQGNINSPLQLPELPLDVTESKEYSLYLKVTDSKGKSVTSERIPVTVTLNPESFRSHLNVIHDEVRHEDGAFVLPAPETNHEDGTVIEWHYVRERSKEEWRSLKPENVKYSSDSINLRFTPLGGEERDGHWVERVKVTVHDAQSPAAVSPIELRISATGPNGIQPVKGTIKMTPETQLTQQIDKVELEFTPGTDELNGSTIAPVVGTELRAKTTCEKIQNCTDLFTYKWEVSADGQRWHTIPGATQSRWIMPPELDGQSLQNRQVRVSVVNEVNGFQ